MSDFDTVLNELSTDQTKEEVLEEIEDQGLEQNSRVSFYDDEVTHRVYKVQNGSKEGALYLEEDVETREITDAEFYSDTKEAMIEGVECYDPEDSVSEPPTTELTI